MNHLTNFSLHKNFNLQNSLQRKYVLPDMCVYHKLIFRIKEVKLGDEIICLQVRFRYEILCLII